MTGFCGVLLRIAIQFIVRELEVCMLPLKSGQSIVLLPVFEKNSRDALGMLEDHRGW